MRCYRSPCSAQLSRHFLVPMISFVQRIRYLGFQFSKMDSRCRRLTIYSLILLVILLCILLVTILPPSPSPNVIEESHSIAVVPVEKTTRAEVLPINWAAYQYAIVLDCGSSGSRVFIYYWPEHSGIRGQLLDMRQLQQPDGAPAVLKLEPGLSSFASDPTLATEQVVKLLAFAQGHIPAMCHRDTYVYIMATAGMRMLKETDQERILSDVRVNVPLRTPFKLLPENVEIISGKWEGIYAWIAINAALGRLGITPDKLRVPDSTPGPASSETVGIIDMGGGSVQIAFELDAKDSPPADVMATFSLGATETDTALNYRLYVATYLGLGANSALKSHFELLTEDRYKAAHSRSIPSTESVITTSNDTLMLTPSPVAEVIVDPCHPAGYSAALNVSIASNNNHPQSVILNGTGSFGSCKTRLQYLLASLSAPTNMPKYAMASCGLFCSPLSGVPSAIAIAGKPPSGIKRKKFYGFSEFWYTMEDCLHLGGSYDRDVFEEKAGSFCAEEWQKLVKDIVQPKYSQADYARFTTQCFKSVWVSVVLHSGFLFDGDTDNFASVQRINGSEVHWTLGSLLYKTRALPLRRIQLVESAAAAVRHSGSSSHIGSRPTIVSNFVPFLPQVTILVCGIIVLLAILFYCHKLSSWRNTARRSGRSPYDQAEMGLLSDDGSDSFNSSSHSTIKRAGWVADGESEIPSSFGRKGRTSLSVGSRMQHLA